MKKLHSFVFYALVAPALTLGTGSALAQNSADENTESRDETNLRDNDREQTYGNDQNDQDDPRERGEERDWQTKSQKSTDRGNNLDQSRDENRGYLGSAPTNGMHASDVIGANVKTTRGDEVGEVTELIIDDQGKVVAAVVAVGGFLGMGEKAVAIGWDDVTASGNQDELEFNIDATRDELSSAPEYEDRELENRN